MLVPAVPAQGCPQSYCSHLDDRDDGSTRGKEEDRDGMEWVGLPVLPLGRRGCLVLAVRPSVTT